MTGPGSDNKQRKRHNIVALSCAGLVAGMVGLSFAAVPLYRLFCQVTGYGGTPQRAETAPNEILDRTIRIRFDANVDRALPWSFKPVDRVIEVKIGETALAFFKAEEQIVEAGYRHCHLQCGAGECRALLRQDRMLLLQAANACAGREH